MSWYWYVILFGAWTGFVCWLIVAGQRRLRENKEDRYGSRQ